ncbi:MAG: amidohydrolase family protein [Anaerolineae bacterium]|nr:amidohydrolase family protein [Anaerolineae bacterium]MCB0237986.1 amidohydrolase family protein [Anaerolineae bacterium]
MTIPIIDCHQHLWDLSKVEYAWLVPAYGPLYRTYLATELEPQMAEAGVSATILVQSANSYADTVYMLDQADVYPWMIGVVGWTDLLDPADTAKAIERFSKNRHFCGVRHLIHEEPDPHWLLQPVVWESLQLLADAGYTFDVVATKHEHLECLPAVGEHVPNLRMVIDHLAQPPFQAGEPGQWGEDMRIAAENPNIYVKISGLGTASGDWASWTADSVRKLVHWTIDLFGAERCMLGGDWPVSVLAGGYVKAFTVYKQLLAERSPAEQEQISYKTAQAFYGVELG